MSQYSPPKSYNSFLTLGYLQYIFEAYQARIYGYIEIRLNSTEPESCGNKLLTIPLITDILLASIPYIT